MVSVIVCTRNRANSLRRLLRSLEEDGSATPAEVIVVDNGSTDDTPTVLAEAQAASRRPFRVVSEPIAGASHGRNVGITAAAGDLLLFTDDDAVVHRGWIDELVRAFEPGVGAVGGRVLPKLVGRKPVWLGEFDHVPLLLCDNGSRTFEMGGSTLPMGVNMGFTREAVGDIPGPFDIRLGHIGHLSMGFEETHLMRLIARRHRIVYAPEAVVDHMVDTDRVTYAMMRRSYFQNGFGRARHWRLSGRDGVPPLHQRVNLALRASRFALSLRWRNRNASEVAPLGAREEFLAYQEAGYHVERLFSETPSVGNWCARWLAH